METSTSLKAVRRAISRLGDRGRTTRIPTEVRGRVLAYARGELEKGKSWKAIGKEVGLSASALQRWAKSCPRPRQRTVVPVAVVGERSFRNVTVALVSPRGYRVEGLELKQALVALRELS